MKYCRTISGMLVAGWLLSCAPSFGADTLTAAPLPKIPIEIRTIPLHAVTNRLRDIRFDEHGIGWIGTGEAGHIVIRFDAATEKAQKVSMGVGNYEKIDTAIPLGDKLFVCGTSSPQQIIYNVKTGQITQVPLKFSTPMIWGGLVIGNYAYLFDYNHGLYRWGATDNHYEFYPYPGKYPKPHYGIYDPERKIIYACTYWMQGQPKTLPLYRFDVKEGKFLDEVLPPWTEAKPLGCAIMGDKLYSMDQYGGCLMVFDLKTQRWTKRYKLPEYGRSWVSSCLQGTLGPYVVCNLTTMQDHPNKNGTLGLADKPSHFVNKQMVFDTRTGQAGLLPIPSLSGGKNKYTTISYLNHYGKRLYGTCVDATLINGVPDDYGEAFLVEFRLKSP